MKIVYRKAGPGKMFALTAFGLEHKHVRDRFEVTNPNRKKFEQSVPVTWLEKGYVMQLWRV